MAFIGPHAVGKTTLLTRLVHFWVQRGWRIGVLKSTKEGRGATDQPGTDTSRYREAGAEPVALWAKEEAVIYHGPLKRESHFWHFIFQHFGDCDLVLAEGFKGLSSLPKIEVARREVSSNLLLETVPGVVALVSDFRPQVSVPVFDLEDIEGLARFVEDRFYRVFEPSVELVVDQKPLGLNRYVRRALEGVVTGFLKSLRGVPQDWEELEIRIKIPSKAGKGGKGQRSGREEG